MLVQQPLWVLASAWSLLVTSSNAQTIEVEGKTVGSSYHVQLI